MTHVLDRDLEGISLKVNGYVLDNPNIDPTNDTLHHVYSVYDSRVFLLNRSDYDRRIQALNRGRPNDLHRQQNAAFKAGDYIAFSWKKIPQRDGSFEYFVNDFVRSETKQDLITVEGRRVFLLDCVFNNDLTKAYSEYFGAFNTDPQAIRNMELIPTPNVTHFCHIGYEIGWVTESNGQRKRTLIPELVRIVGINTEMQEYSENAPWNKGTAKKCMANLYDDEEVDIEETEEEKLQSLKHKRCFVTGLTSVYLLDHPTLTVLLPNHNLKQHSIGRFTECAIVFNETLEKYIVHHLESTISTRFHTMLSRSRSDVTGVFYVDINLKDSIHGIYKHPYFRLIADPYGYLDMCRVLIEHLDFKCANNPGDQELLRGRASLGRPVFTVPIRDRLGTLNNTKTLSDLDMVTRFEVASPGDIPEQLEIIRQVSKYPLKMKEQFGVVINERHNRVFAYKTDTSDPLTNNFHGVYCELPEDHSFSDGDHIRINAKRNVDPDIHVPTMLINEAFINDTKKLCKSVDGWFKLAATYNVFWNCYESVVFGFIPCKKPPPKPSTRNQPKNLKHVKPSMEQLYLIRAKENCQVPVQTLFCNGEFISKLD